MVVVTVLRQVFENLVSTSRGQADFPVVEILYVHTPRRCAREMNMIRRGRKGWPPRHRVLLSVYCKIFSGDGEGSPSIIGGLELGRLMQCGKACPGPAENPPGMISAY